MRPIALIARRELAHLKCRCRVRKGGRGDFERIKHHLECNLVLDGQKQKLRLCSKASATLAR